MTAGEIESNVRLLKSRGESRARSPSAGAIQAVSMLGAGRLERILNLYARLAASFALSPLPKMFVPSLA